MPTTMLEQATTVIEKAWGQPLAALEVVVRRPSEDPLLRSAMHTRTALAIADHTVTVHQDRLHALSRRGDVPDFYELDRIAARQSASASPTQRAVRISRRSGTWWRLGR